MDFSNINFLAVLVSTIAGFALGALWYSPLLFGKTWQRETGLSEENIKKMNPAKTYGSSFILMFFMALGLSAIFSAHPEQGADWMMGLRHGLLYGGFFVATSAGINYLYQGKSFTLWAIDVFYQLAFLAVVGLILGAWH